MITDFKSAMIEPTYRIVFKKKNGQEHYIRCQVDKDYCTHRSGKSEYIVVFDLNKCDWRTVNTDTIISFELV
jgi:hypothetical protein